MKQIPSQTKEEAVALRQQGKTYAEISEQVGVSLDWCKRNLKSVRQEEKLKFEALYAKGKSSTGVSRTEVFNTLNLSAQDKSQHNKLLSSAVKRIRANNKENIVRPDWMIPTAARFCTDTIVGLSMDIEERCDEEAYQLHNQLRQLDSSEPVPSVQKIKAAILGLALASVTPNKASGTKLHNWLESLYRATNALEGRNAQQSISELTVLCKDLCCNLEETIY